MPLLIPDRQSFDTHFNYIRCLNTLTSGSTLSYLNRCLPQPIPHIGTKENLIDLTSRSLREEHSIVQIDEDYSYASTSWLPIKSYYLLFNVLLTIEYLLKLQMRVFRTSHIACIEEFTRKLRDHEIEFNRPLLNSVFDRTIFEFRESPGANLSLATNNERMYKMAMRKVAQYKLDDWIKRNNISLKANAGRQQKENYLTNFSISIFEFPYMMRIRANYRDFAFIDGVTTRETRRYFNTYYDFTLNFFNALNILKRHLQRCRTL